MASTRGRRQDFVGALYNDVMVNSPLLQPRRCEHKVLVAKAIDTHVVFNEIGESFLQGWPSCSFKICTWLRSNDVPTEQWRLIWKKEEKNPIQEFCIQKYFNNSCRFDVSKLACLLKIFQDILIYRKKYTYIIYKNLPDFGVSAKVDVYRQEIQILFVEGEEWTGRSQVSKRRMKPGVKLIKYTKWNLHHTFAVWKIYIELKSRYFRLLSLNTNESKITSFISLMETLNYSIKFSKSNKQ